MHNRKRMSIQKCRRKQSLTGIELSKAFQQRCRGAKDGRTYLARSWGDAKVAPIAVIHHENGIGDAATATLNQKYIPEGFFFNTARQSHQMNANMFITTLDVWVREAVRARRQDWTQRGMHGKANRLCFYVIDAATSHDISHAGLQAQVPPQPTPHIIPTL